MVAGLVVSIDGGLKLTALEHPRINYRRGLRKVRYLTYTERNRNRVQEDDLIVSWWRWHQGRPSASWLSAPCPMMGRC